MLGIAAVKYTVKRNWRKGQQAELARATELILSLHRIGYQIPSIHAVAQKKASWFTKNPTEYEWNALFDEGRVRRKQEVEELVNLCGKNKPVRTLVTQVVAEGDVALNKIRVQRAKEILPILVEHGYDLHQLKEILDRTTGDLSEDEIREALLVLINRDDATSALKDLAVELGVMYKESRDVGEVVGRVAEVGISVLESAWELLVAAGEFFADIMG